MAYAPVSYVGDSVETDYTIGFPYVRSGYVVVEVDAVPTTAWSFIVSGTKIRFDSPPATDAAIDISRLTPLVPVVDFADGAGLPEADLDDVVLQFHHALDETIFNAITGLGKSGGHWDAVSLRIQNVANPITDDEAANKGSISAQVTAAELAETNAQSSEDDAQTSEDAAAVSETNAATSETNAAASATALPTISGGDAEKFLTINAGEVGYDKETPAAVAAALAPLMPRANRLFVEKPSDSNNIGTSEVDLAGLTGLTIPGTPDGFKKYEISGRLIAGNDLTNLKVWIGANGTKADTLILIAEMGNMSASIEGGFNFTPFEFIPDAADTKLGLSVKFGGSTNDNIQGGGLNASYILIQQVT